MTTTQERPVVVPPLESVLDARRPPRPAVRWLGWTVGVALVAAIAVLTILALQEPTGESFESLYEAESELSLGAVHVAGYETPQRWVGNSDMTLEEFEMMIMDAWVADAVYEAATESFEELYEAESGLALGAVHEPGYEPPLRFVGESDGTLEEFEAGLIPTAE